MIRRVLRPLLNLSKSISRISLLNGQEDLSEVCIGYYPDGNGLELCPAFTSKVGPVINAENLYPGKYYASMGMNVFLSTQGKVILFRNEENTYNIFPDIEAGNPFAVEMRNENGDALLVILSGNKMCTYNCSSLQRGIRSMPGSVYGGIAHCGRIFAISEENGYKVVWSGLTLNDWEEGIDGSGHILLDSDLGKVLILENFGDDVLCVRECGFTVIHAMADSRNFRISTSQNSVKTGEKINVGGVVGQKYYFTKAGGIYSFDGASITLEYSVDSALSSVGRAYVYGDGYVYADCVYNGTDCIMRYDPSCGKAIFYGAKCSMPMSFNGYMYCVKGGMIGRMSAENTSDDRLWRSKPLGGYGRKTLKYLYVDAIASPDITVYCDGTSRRITGTGRIPVNLSGENIYVEISGNSPVKNVVCELEVRK